ncbi:MAG: nucleoside monophosphate kinase [Candidatus Niyogibacteria bacterium]|nr:nucleoside monophosphate kinase [Candidatus Niyogibacteria bacterium]
MENLLNFIFIGRSGSGKGTQAELLKKHLEEKYGPDSVLYIYTGAKLRELVGQKEFLTARLVDEKVMKAGAKAPDFLAVWAWASRFIQEMDEKKNLIVDGSPRTILEAKMLDESFLFYGRKKVFPVFIDVSREEATRRMKKRGRPDDTAERIENRLAYYEKYVRPALDYYKTESKNKIIQIDGNPLDPELIHQNVLKAVGLKR